MKYVILKKEIVVFRINVLKNNNSSYKNYTTKTNRNQNYLAIKKTQQKTKQPVFILLSSIDWYIIYLDKFKVDVTENNNNIYIYLKGSKSNNSLLYK